MGYSNRGFPAALLVGLVCLGVAFGQASSSQTAPPPNQPPATPPAVPNQPPPLNRPDDPAAANQQPPVTPPAAVSAQPPAAVPAVNPNPPETVTRDEPATFKARVNLVMVPVVVRDKQGHAVGGLHQEDFLLFDKNKPQVITRFSSEKSGGKGKPAEPDAKTPEKTSDQSLPPDAPERFLAYLFDDIHVNAGDLMRVREAAHRHMAAMGPAERAAIFTTSGQIELEFTDDRDKFYATLLKLMPRSLTGKGIADCPDLSYYMADLIANKNDTIALGAAAQEAMACMNMDPSQPGALQTATNMANAAARREVSNGDHETRVSLIVMKEVIRRMSAMPGQRTLILASPGFITPEQQTEKSEVMDLAIRNNVIISSVDARGLYTDPTFDASRPSSMTSTFMRVKAQYDREAARAQADVLAEMATGTGGAFFENNNDLEAGFKRVAAAPEYFYVLGFSPQNLKFDGSFHGLKVSLKDPEGLTSQARRGYYAPKHMTDAQENAKEELREAIFSREEMRDLPVDLHTQFFKPTDQSARVTVLAHVDLKRLRLRKADGRNRNDLTIVSALFDRNGNYVTGNQKLLEMRLKDETIEKRAEAGITVRTSFDVKPGTYLVRLVVRDAEGQQMSAANGSVEIP
ncbi:MAG TPA: VWA domain-containing protein [Bryobacteraceae bacterium]|nr:VWA domain-containing protein [Bryobacteraceae bacterium]